jgi:hypothetical protein
MTQNFAILLAAMPPEVQSRSADKVKTMMLEMQLRAPRKSRSVTQIEMANLTSLEQEFISKRERHQDMYVSTLCAYIKALGGAKIGRAHSPDTDIHVHPLSLAS